MHPYPSPEQVSMRSMPNQYPFPSAAANPTKPPKPSLRKSRGFYITRLALRTLIVILSLAIVGVLSNALREYRKTKDMRQMYAEGSGSYPVWPKDSVKMVGVLWLLGTACVVAGLGVVLLVASVSKKVRHMTKTGNLTTVVVSVVGLVLWIAVTAYYASWDTKQTGWDLMSWACTHSAPSYSYTGINFGDICGEMRVAIHAAIALAVLEFVNLVVFVVWLVMQRRGRRGGNEKEDMEDTAMLVETTAAAGTLEVTAGWTNFAQYGFVW